MEGQAYIRAKIKRTMMSALALLLEDMVGRNKNQIDSEELDLEDCLRIAEARNTAEELRHLLTISPEALAVTPTHQDESNPTTTYKEPHAEILSTSRIMKKVRNGEIKKAPEKPGDSETINLGVGQIEISENDEVIDIVGPTKSSRESLSKPGKVIPYPDLGKFTDE